MKNAILFTILLTLIFASCSKYRKCPSSIRGQIIDQVSGEPIAGVKVFAQGIGETSGWGNSEYLPFDTIVTDQNGEYLFESELNIPNWNIKVYSSQYVFVTTSFWQTSCQNLEEDIELLEFARVFVSTVDDPNINQDSLSIFALPSADRMTHGEDYGKDDIMIPNETAIVWLKPDPEGLIRYWFLNEQNIEGMVDIPYHAEPGEVIELTVKM